MHDKDCVTDRFCSGASRALHLASLFACIVVLLSFALFVIDQADKAVASPQAAQSGPDVGPVLGEAAAAGTGQQAAPSRPGRVRRAIDDASSAIASPFRGLTGRLTDVWLVHLVQTLLVLAVFGFGLSVLARVVRMDR